MMKGRCSLRHVFGLRWIRRSGMTGKKYDSRSSRTCAPLSFFLSSSTARPPSTVASTSPELSPLRDTICTRVAHRLGGRNPCWCTWGCVVHRRVQLGTREDETAVLRRELLHGRAGTLSGGRE